MVLIIVKDTIGSEPIYFGLVRSNCHTNNKKKTQNALLHQAKIGFQLFEKSEMFFFFFWIIES